VCYTRTAGVTSIMFFRTTGYCRFAISVQPPRSIRVVVTSVIFTFLRSANYRPRKGGVSTHCTDLSVTVWHTSHHHSTHRWDNHLRMCRQSNTYQWDTNLRISRHHNIHCRGMWLHIRSHHSIPPPPSTRPTKWPTSSAAKESQSTDATAEPANQ